MATSDSDRGSLARRVSNSSAVVEEPPSNEALRYCNLEDFLEHLGVDHASAGSLIMAAAQHMFAAPLPPQWSEQVDEGSGRVYFFNRATGESLWQHPQKPLFEEILAEVRCWQPEASVESLVARAERHLRQAQQSALEVLSQWSAFDAPQGPEEAPEFGETSRFFFNATTGESSWADPRQLVDFDLRLRHGILSECMAAFRAHSLPDESSEGELSSHAERDTSVQELDIRELLGTLSLPLRQLDAALPGMRPPHATSAGDDTVRSSMSYLTARSTVTEDPRSDTARQAR